MNALTTQEIKKSIDALGEIETKLKAYDDLIKQRETLRKQLSTIADQEPHSNEVTFQGDKYLVTFSKNPVNRELKPEQYGEFLKSVGVEMFLKCAKVSVTSADKALSELEKARLFSTVKGSRRLKSVVIIPTPNSSENAAIEAFYASLSGILESVNPARPGSL